MRSMSAAALPAGARESPVPNSASTQTSGRSGLSTAISRTPACRARRRFSTASALFGSSASTKAASPPRCLSNRAAASPSPPLPPGPQAKKTVFPGPKRSSSKAASAAAARSMTSMDLTPSSAKYICSIARICSGVKSVFPKISMQSPPRGGWAAVTHIHTARARTRRPPARPLFFPPHATKARRLRGNPALCPRAPRF